MRTIRVFPVALLLAGCDSLVQMNANSNAARVQVAALQSQAIVGAEWARTQAAASVAQSQAMSEVARTVAWSSQLPWVVGAVCVTVIIVAILYWRGRVAVGATGPVYPPALYLPMPTPQAKVLPQQRKALQDFAREQGGQVVWTPEGTPLLQVDGQRRQLRITAKPN